MTSLKKQLPPRGYIGLIHGKTAASTRAYINRMYDIPKGAKVILVRTVDGNGSRVYDCEVYIPYHLRR